MQASALRRLSCGDPRTAQHVPHAARAFGPGAANPRATTDGGQHFFQAGKRCHSLRAGGRRLCNTTGLNFATTGIPGLPSTCRMQHVPSAQVLLTPVLRLTAGSTSSRQEKGVTPSEREEGVYVTPVVAGWPPLHRIIPVLVQCTFPSTRQPRKNRRTQASDRVKRRGHSALLSLPPLGVSSGRIRSSLGL